MSNLADKNVFPEYVPLKYILPVTSIGIFMSAMDSSIVNVSLKTIADALQTDMQGVRWVIIAYLLTISSLMGISGSLGDAYGRKIIFQIGMTFFSIGSLFCGLSTSLTILILSRIIQAIGAAGIMANGLAIVITYIDPQIRGRAIGVNTVVVAGSLSIGPIIGGILTQYFGWESIFFINVPIGLIGIVATQIIIKETNIKKDVKLDIMGMLLFTYTTLAFITGIMFLFQGKLSAIILLISSFLTAIAFYFKESHHSNPIIPVGIMKDRQIIMGITSAVFAFMSINSLIFLFPFYLQEVLHYNQSATGFFMAIIPLALVLTGPPIGYLADKINAGKIATFGIFIQTLFILMLGLSFIYWGPDLSIIFIVILIGLTAAFLSVFTNSNATSVMNAAPKSNISTVSGTLNLSRTVGFTLGTALSSALFTVFFNYYESQKRGMFIESYNNSLGLSLLIFAALNIFGIILSLSRGEERIVKY